MSMTFEVRPQTCQTSSPGRPHICRHVCAFTSIHVTECDAKVPIQPTSLSHNTLYFTNSYSRNFVSLYKKKIVDKKKKPAHKMQTAFNENI